MKKYQIIYADPPWRYEHPISDSRKIENQYPTMELEDIKSILVPSEDDSLLFMWTTAPKLLEGLEVMARWGFVYRTHAIWDKGSIGMGYWFRNQHEVLMVGLKGKFPAPPPYAAYFINFQRAKNTAQFKAKRHTPSYQRMVSERHQIRNVCPAQ